MYPGYSYATAPVATTQYPMMYGMNYASYPAYPTTTSSSYGTAYQQPTSVYSTMASGYPPSTYMPPTGGVNTYTYPTSPRGSAYNNPTTFGQQSHLSFISPQVSNANSHSYPNSNNNTNATEGLMATYGSFQANRAGQVTSPRHSQNPAVSGGFGLPTSYPSFTNLPTSNGLPAGAPPPPPPPPLSPSSMHKGPSRSGLGSLTSISNAGGLSPRASSQLGFAKPNSTQHSFSNSSNISAVVSDPTGGMLQNKNTSSLGLSGMQRAPSFPTLSSPRAGNTSLDATKPLSSFSKGHIAGSSTGPVSNSLLGTGTTCALGLSNITTSCESSVSPLRSSSFLSNPGGNELPLTLPSFSSLPTVSSGVALTSNTFRPSFASCTVPLKAAHANTLLSKPLPKEVLKGSVMQDIFEHLGHDGRYVDAQKSTIGLSPRMEQVDVGLSLRTDLMQSDPSAAQRITSRLQDTIPYPTTAALIDSLKSTAEAHPSVPAPILASTSPSNRPTNTSADDEGEDDTVEINLRLTAENAATLRSLPPKGIEKSELEVYRDVQNHLCERQVGDLMSKLFISVKANVSDGVMAIIIRFPNGVATSEYDRIVQAFEETIPTPCADAFLAKSHA